MLPFQLSGALAKASMSLPFPPPDASHDECLEDLISHLPPLSDAADLTEAYLVRNTWAIKPVERNQVADELLPMFYRKGRPSIPDHVSAEHLHHLALLFMIMSCGLSASPEIPDAPSRIGLYYNLSRASLCLGRIVEHGSVAACQTLLLFAVYTKNGIFDPTREVEDKFFGLALTIASSVSLYQLLS